jgi:hypothetical protein
MDKFFISTIHRRSSAMLAPDTWYYETLVWEWNYETKQRGAIVDQGYRDPMSREGALEEHAAICARWAATTPEHKPDRKDE